MKYAMASVRFIFTCAISVLVLSGCATSRSVFDVPVPLDNSKDGKIAVKLVEVIDLRRFETAPRDPSTPSLGDPAQINDRSITSRALARKRGGFGMAFSDILLPEGRTVEQVVRETVTNALLNKGYAVVNLDDPAHAAAPTLKVQIQKFWSWFTPGFFTISLECESVLNMQSDNLLAQNTESVRGYAHVNALAATDGEWQTVMQRGVDDLIQKVSEKLRKPAELAP